MAEASDFLSGCNGAWTACNFDWLLNTENFLKVLEGNYKNKQQTQVNAQQKPKKNGFINFSQRTDVD